MAEIIRLAYERVRLVVLDLVGWRNPIGRADIFREVKSLLTKIQLNVLILPEIIHQVIDDLEAEAFVEAKGKPPVYSITRLGRTELAREILQHRALHLIFVAIQKSNLEMRQSTSSRSGAARPSELHQ